MHVLVVLRKSSESTPTGTQSCSLAATVALPTCMHLSSCRHVHGNAYSVLRSIQSAGPVPPRHQNVMSAFHLKKKFLEIIMGSR